MTATTQLRQWGKCVPSAIECKAMLCDLACSESWNMQPEMYRYIISCICYIENCAKACHNCTYSMNMRNVCAFTREQVMNCRDCCSQCIECCNQTLHQLDMERRSYAGHPNDNGERGMHVNKYNACVGGINRFIVECQGCVRECDVVMGVKRERDTFAYYDR